jgi:hypothetical protein
MQKDAETSKLVKGVKKQPAHPKCTISPIDLMRPPQPAIVNPSSIIPMPPIVLVCSSAVGGMHVWETNIANAVVAGPQCRITFAARRKQVMPLINIPDI